MIDQTRTADTQDRAGAYADLARRAHTEGPGVWWAPLSTVEDWKAAGVAVQDVVASEVARCLGAGWRLDGMRVWGCANRRQCQSCHGRGHVDGGFAGEEYGLDPCPRCHRGTASHILSYRLALFVHLATGAEFSLLPGKALGNCEDCLNTAAQGHIKFCGACQPTKPLLAARWPVTIHQCWVAGTENEPYGADSVVGLPRVQISHATASKWCEKWGLRLPTAAEWTHAARGGVDTRYPWGDKLDLSYVWCAENSGRRADRPGFYREPRPRPPAEHDAAGKANAFGLVDVFGNVMEWCADVAEDPETGILGNVAMGGSYACPRRDIERLATSGYAVGGPMPWVGFRPVCDVPDWRAE